MLEKDFNQSAETDFKLGITSLSLTSDYRKINWRNVWGDVHSRYSCKLNFGKFIGKRLPWSSFSHQSFNFLQRCFIQETALFILIKKPQKPICWVEVFWETKQFLRALSFFHFLTWTIKRICSYSMEMKIIRFFSASIKYIIIASFK